MNEELVADMVSFEEDDAMAVFAFCANEGQSAEYLMLQYPLQTDEQDRRLRLDGLYIERDDQAFGCYRGVESIRKIGDRIEIDLNAEGKRRLKVERMVIVPVHWSPEIDQGLARLAELSRGEYDVQVK
ncbi:Imm10 family immunity protein [Massilia niastensis]|uniref:Imm10 family immunity protein n=1 Tax=Massilia niastensis TaxID=544911 RepID=UPI00059469A4|nr:Imm10 family immunity protein [Massilia niastensis]